MFKRISIFPVLLLAACAVFIAGCGSSGDDTVTKAEFIKEAEAICKKASTAEEQQQGEFVQQNLARLKREPPPPNDKGTAEIVQTIRVPSVLKEVEELEALEQPEGDEAKLKKIYAGTTKGIEELDAEPKLVWASRAGNPLYPSYKEAIAYGFKFCAES